MKDPSNGTPLVQVIPNWFMAIVSTPIIIGLLYFGRDLLVPLAIALLLFILTAALVDRIDRAKIAGWSPPRWVARLIGLAIVFLGFATIAIVLSNEAENFVEAIPRYTERFDQLGTRIQGLLGAEILSAVERSLAEVDVGAWVAGFASGASGMLVSFSLVLIYLAFLFAERNKFAVKLPLMATSESDAGHVRGVLRAITDSVKQYMWINAITSTMSGTAAYIIFRFIDLDFAATLALIVFMVGFIPNIGAFIGIALPALVALLQFDSWTPFLVVVLGYGGVDQFIGNVIQPTLQGKSLNLSTFMVMLSLSFWGMVWGGIGAFLAIPMTVIVMIICSEIGPLRPVAILLSGDGKLLGSTQD